MSHELLGFLSGTFRGSQQRCATVDKKGFTIVSTFRRLEYVLWGGVSIFTHHRNISPISRTRGHRVQGAYYPYPN